MPKRLTTAKKLTGRDYEILRFIGSGGLATVDQLHRKFWAGKQKRTARERLLQLEKAGWLKTHFVAFRQREEQELVLVLTSKGAVQHFSAAERERFIIGLPASHEQKQQLLFQETRLAIEEQLAQYHQHTEGDEMVSSAHQSGLKSPLESEFKGQLKLVDWRNEHELRREQVLAKRKSPGEKWRRRRWSEDVITTTTTLTSATSRQSGFRQGQGPVSRSQTAISDGQGVLEHPDGRQTTFEVEIDGATLCKS